MENKTVLIPVKNLNPNPDNPRFEAGDVSDLARSITEDDLLHPILVIPAPWIGPDQYLIEDGYRRWVASKDYNDDLPCIIRDLAPDEDPKVRALITGLVTDLHKEHLTPLERARAYGRLRDEAEMTQDQIAQRLGVNTSTVSRYLALLELSDKSQEDIRAGKLSVENAIKAVQKVRAKNRKKKGMKPVDIGWEPDHFTDRHHLAKRAGKLCDAREHTSRRRYGKIACGQCWEDAIRQDQTTVLQAAYLDSQREGNNPIFLPPFNTADGAARPGVIGNGI